MKIGYARVSTDEQNLALQLDALKGAGCDVIHEDRLSGAVKRPGLAQAIAACAAGDVLIVWKLDRLGRSLPDLVGLSETLKSRDIGLKVLTGAGAAIDTMTPEGRLFFGMFAVIAEFERELIRERTKAGMNAARRRGKRVGRPLSLTPEKLDLARRLVAEGKGKAMAARMIGVNPATLRRGLGGLLP
jgi:DNA invertase Pin-like site-specific DNA recombinase